MTCVYILYSETLQKFYIGFSTIELNIRIEKHLSNYYQNKFTAKTKDWELFFQIQCESDLQARKIELHIKKMKSKTYIQNLKKYPEIAEKLLNLYKNS